MTFRGPDAQANPLCCTESALLYKQLGYKPEYHFGILSKRQRLEIPQTRSITMYGPTRS